MLTSMTTQPSATGTTMKERSAVTSTRDGATTNTRRSENGGVQSSLKRILNVSASDLQQAERADPVGAVAVLHQAEQPALVPDQAGGDGEHDDEDQQHRQELPVPGGDGDERVG